MSATVVVVAKRVERRAPRTGRNRRSVGIARTFVELHARRPGSRENVVCHRHLGGTLVVTVDDRTNLPTGAWSDVTAFFPIKCKFVSDSSKLRALVLRTLRPRIVYLNDGALLAPLSDRPLRDGRV